ncbi:MAG TPA: PH domain-containing protein [Leadbetterella sp.]|nr:PH domain-containing protein [Leadbetterella sp.]
MAIDLLVKLSVTEKGNKDAEKHIFEPFLAKDEELIFVYNNIRDRIAFTSKKIISYDVKGFTGSKKEYRFFLYSKITSFAVETSGLFDYDSDFVIWVSGLGKFEIKFGRKLDIKELGTFISSKLS